MNSIATKLRPLSASSSPVKVPVILAVDDDRTMLMMLVSSLEAQNYQVLTARSGEEALEILSEGKNTIDAIILDREMTGISGMEVLARLRRNELLHSIPVIMLTATSGSNEIQQGIEAGVFYYLIKPVDNALLHSIVSSALRDRKQKGALINELNRQDVMLKTIKHCMLEVRHIHEAENVACFLASCFPDPKRVVNGLLELLINAVEHGSLDIDYNEKAKLLETDSWRAEVERREAMPENADKIVTILFQKKPDGCYVQITDQGKGFDWKRYLQIDSARATHSHGRGIARARLLSFDNVVYNETGNQVTAVCLFKTEHKLVW